VTPDARAGRLLRRMPHSWVVLPHRRGSLPGSYSGAKAGDGNTMARAVDDLNFRRANRDQGRPS
jgi:hypothetical protein